VIEGNHFQMSSQYTFDDKDGAVRLRTAWDAVVRSLADLSPSAVEKFIRPLRPTEFDAGKVVLVAPGAFAAEWVRSKYLHRIQEALGDELGEPITIDFRINERAKAAASESSYVVPPITVEATGFNPVKKYRFETFVTGGSNRMAFAGAKQVALAPGEKYNPLFIYGSSGLGKTHLLHAIANELLARDPRLSIAYLTAQQFAEQFIQALQSNRIDHFRRMQRNIGIWLVDDIQFVAGKDRTQEEIFHTFNLLHQTGKQIVMCSDRPPHQLYLMDDRLRSRLESGLVVDIQEPDTELRAAILMQKAQQEHLELPTEVALFVAEHVSGNVRLLEGALTKLGAVSSVEGRALDMALAEAVIAEHYSHRVAARPGFDQIVESVGKYYKIPVDDIKGISRKAPIAHARHVAVFLTRQITGDSWKHIGTLFGDRDHTSMMHAYQKISEMVARDKDLAMVVKTMIRNLKPQG